ncbi:uroporphyrinogen-III synthase [Candidatus Sulfurimonas marisnigri]|uniref:Uroporphyrinogen-III synthase n=1 Tax=Candidatus Sulfurimonas marisnigri TaxID=2740405 RepID=A0A7S7M1Z2_9BACT|nr:uroporphyrinogen-III synthase [Candidatus Sulfurimonas marisnigri]QOY55023.1 uroporphyrinogen-III synthase [Candidatus Sulfurimonas marisnigri]
MARQIYLFSTSSHPKATCINSLNIRYLNPDIDFSKYDYLIITSKQAIKALNQYNIKDFIHLPALCVSSNTATEYKNIGGNILVAGEGYGDGLLEKIEEFSKETKWLYLRAQTVASDFAQVAKKNDYKIDEKILYVSECSEETLNLHVENSATLIFTSPSSVECFLKTHTIASDSKIIVIGKTTAKSIPKNIEYKVSKETSIESCIELALSF